MKNIAIAVVLILFTAAIASAADKNVTSAKIQTAGRAAVTTARIPGNRTVQTTKTIAQLNTNYMRAKSRYRLPRGFRRKGEKTSGNSELEVYLALVGPTNECTILVRKVCGVEKQCPTSPGCPVAIQLLEQYNAATSTEKDELKGSCLIALEDSIIFNQCNNS